MPIWTLVHNAFSIVLSTLCLVAFGLLLWNLVLLKQNRKRGFFRIRSVKLLILTIIPSAIQVFILVPMTLISFHFNINNIISNNQNAMNLQILLHTSTLNVWFFSIFTRIWFVFVQIRKQQDSLQWKKVCFISCDPCFSIFFLLFVCLVCTETFVCCALI